MLENISINKIRGHKDNPRKDLGDITELAESIKKNGILQNLTVVPAEEHEDEFTIVIGHRRLAAAKLAGLDEVPCVIAEMTPKEQIATMLLENIQRADLSVYEQAQGFQMMLDLGDTVNDIAEHTGFSVTTVKRRVKLLELDPEKFKKSSEKNVSLMDYAELDKIEDIEARNRVLEFIGTKNFKYEVEKAVDDEKRKKNTEKYVNKLSTFASETNNTSGMRYVQSYYPSQDEKIEIPDDADTVKYYYFFSTYGQIALYKEQTESEESENEAEKKRRRLNEEKCDALDEISQRAYELRKEFVKNLSYTKIKKKIGKIIEILMKHMIESYSNFNLQDIAEMREKDISEGNELKFEDIVEELRQQPERYLLFSAYCSLDSHNENYHSWNCKYMKNEELDSLYPFLEELGYEISDEEKNLMNGTHELFTKDTDESE